MNRIVTGIVVGLVLICLTLYLSGVVFLLANKINPLDHATLFGWFDYWSNYPEARTQLYKISLIVLSLLVVVVALGVANRTKIALHGESRFASQAEIKAAGLMKDQGVIVGKLGHRFLMYASTQFISLLAPTRSGKGVGIVIPNLLNYSGSTVVQDIKLENWSITSKYRAEHGQAVFLFNPFASTSHRYNPLGYVSTNPHLRPAEVLAIGYMLFPRGDDKNSMWSDTARDLFVGICLYMLETPNTVASIGEALRISSGKGKPLKEYLTELIRSRNYNAVKKTDDNGETTTEYVPREALDKSGIPQLSGNCVDSLNRFISAPDNTAGGILTTFNAPLTLWASPVVDAATTENDFDLRLIRKQRMSVYIGIPVNKLAEAGVILRLFYSQLINLNTDELFGSDGNNVPCLLVMDEFTAPRYIPIIAEGAAYIAGYGLRLLTIAQSKAQVSKPISEGGYGREGATALFTNHAMNIMYTPKELTDANEYSEALGYDTVKSRSMQLRSRFQGTESDQKRALMLPQELMRMPQTKQIIQLEGVRPIKCEKIRYYNEPVFISRLKEVSPSLARLGKKKPTEEQLQFAWSSGELSAPVPKINVDLFQAKQNNRTRPAKPSDVKGGVDLQTIAVDFSAIETVESDDSRVMTDEEITKMADSFFDALGFDSDATVENVDLDTGEWLGDSVEPVDLNQLIPA